MDKNPLRGLEIDLRKEGDLRTKRRIAKKLKGYGFLNDGFIAEVVELDIKTVARLKGDAKHEQD